MNGEAAWARHRQTTDDTSNQQAIPRPISALSQGDLALAAQLSQQRLDHTPEDPDLLRLLLVAQIALSDVTGAQDTAKRLEATPLKPDTLDALLTAYLAADRVRCARELVARGMNTTGVPAWALDAARARIAIHRGDYAAARAILVRGIERTPDAQALRVLMLEVLLADGDGAYAREITSRLGQPASLPVMSPANGTDPEQPDLADQDG